MHVYKFLQKGGQLDLQSDTFEQLKPGLSSYADAPEEAAKSLIPLLETALKTVPTELQASSCLNLLSLPEVIGGAHVLLAEGAQV